MNEIECDCKLVLLGGQDVSADLLIAPETLCQEGTLLIELFAILYQNSRLLTVFSKFCVIICKWCRPPVERRSYSTPAPLLNVSLCRGDRDKFFSVCQQKDYIDGNYSLAPEKEVIQQNAKYRDSSRSVMTRKKIKPTSAASATINNRNRAKHKYYVPC